MYGIIFDVDGVIADTEGINALATARVLAEEFGVEGVSRQDFEAGLGRGAVEYVRAGAVAHNLVLSEEELARAAELRQRHFLGLLAEARLEPYPGVRELIESAMARDDFRVAIATSSTRQKSRAVLRAVAIPYKEMVYVTGDDVAKRKPDPELFRLAVHRMGTQPGACVVVEDAPDGVESAHRAGCRCIGVTNTATAEKLRQADLVVESMTQISIDRVAQLAEVGGRRSPADGGGGGRPNTGTRG